jgi:hypothetical protein
MQDAIPEWVESQGKPINGLDLMGLRLVTAIAGIKTMLHERRDTLLRDQATREHRAGDLIWHPNTGWGIVKEVSSAKVMDAYLHLRGETTRVVKKGYFVNIRMAAEQSADLKQYLLETGVIL